MTRKWFSRAINAAFIVVLLLLVFRPAAKGWVLRQLMAIGLFRADAEKSGAVAATPVVLYFADSSGLPFNTASLKGKTIFINFWASWCPPCRAEMSGLNELKTSLNNDQNLVFIFVNEDEDRSKATAYLAENNFQFPIFKLRQRAPLNVYSGTLPTTIVINSNGELVYRHDGLANYNTASFRKYLRSL